MRKKTGCPIHDGESAYIHPESGDMRCEECVENDRQPGWSESWIETLTRKLKSLVSASDSSDKSEHQKNVDDKP